MLRAISKALLRAAFALAIVFSWSPASSIGQTLCAVVSATPNSFSAGTSPAVTLNTNGTIDLSIVTSAQLGMRPNTGISNIKITQQSAQTLTFSADIASSATPGVRTLFVNDPNGHEVVALDVTIKAFVPPPPPPPVCTPPCDPETQVCEAGRCVARAPPTCTPRCRPPAVCTPEGCRVPQ